MKYISIDIETTGLNPETDSILEIGMIYEDTSKNLPLKDLPFLNILLPKTRYTVSPYIMEFHKKLFQELGAYQPPFIPFKSDDLWICKEEHLQSLIKEWLDELGCDSVLVAGKNFFSFDYNFLKKYMPEIKFKHRSLDPAMLYLTSNDEAPPNLETCCERAGIELKNHHTAIGDALTVIELIRKKYDQLG